MLNILRIITLLLSFSFLFSQVGTWKNLPTMTEIQTLLPVDSQILIASNGGILTFSIDTETFGYGIDGEQTDNLDVRSIYIDSDSILWVGSHSPGPIVEVVDLSTNSWGSVEFVDLDEVSSFVQVGDSIYATFRDGLDGGLLLYRKNGLDINYLDIFNNFPTGFNLDLTTVNDVLHLGNRLVFRTDYSLLWIELDGSNLKDPANWNVSALPADNARISRLIEFEGGLMLAAGSALYAYDFQDFTLLTEASGEILDLHLDNEQSSVVIFNTNSGLFSYHHLNNTSEHLYNKSGIYAIGVRNGRVWTANQTDFLGSYNGEIYEIFSANRPMDHFFNHILIDDEGQLIGGAKNGISIHNNLGWRTIQAGDLNSSFNELMYNWNEMILDTLNYAGDAVVEDMVSDSEGNIYFSIQGEGVLKLDSNQPGESAFFNASEDVLESTFNSDTYILPGQMAVDSKANVWLTTKFVQDGGNVITILGSDGQVYHIDQYLDDLNSRTIKSIAIDDNDLVWTGSQVVSDLQASGGLSLIDYHRTTSDPMVISASNLLGAPLASNEILQLEVDTRNVLWILTDAGVQSMPLPNQWLTSSELKNWASLYMTSVENDYWQLTDYNVTSMEIDQRGNHWFLSSNAGLHVLLENGRWINSGVGYNTGNSGLLDNEIYAAAFDSESGRAYFSTPKGVSILNTSFADPKESYSNIHIYPQPFKPGAHEKVIIQGLMDNSSVKILTISGKLVKELNAEDNTVQGYEAQWNGRDRSGDLVGSGVYILYLFNEGGEASSQKLAILR